jgi:hypothetical protein
VGRSRREEIDWISPAAARGRELRWAAEGLFPARVERRTTYRARRTVEPLFDYDNRAAAAVTAASTVRDPSLPSRRPLPVRGLLRRRSSAARPQRAAPATGHGPRCRRYPPSARTRRTALRREQPGQPGGAARGGPHLRHAEHPAAHGPVRPPGRPGHVSRRPSRLFVAEQSGHVRLVVDGVVRPTPYLDVTAVGFSTGGERGLLSVVASPDYSTSGRLYVYYTAGDGDIRIDEVTRSAANAEVADQARAGTCSRSSTPRRGTTTAARCTSAQTAASGSHGRRRRRERPAQQRAEHEHPARQDPPD